MTCDLSFPWLRSPHARLARLKGEHLDQERKNKAKQEALDNARDEVYSLENQQLTNRKELTQERNGLEALKADHKRHALSGQQSETAAQKSNEQLFSIRQEDERFKRSWATHVQEEQTDKFRDFVLRGESERFIKCPRVDYLDDLKVLKFNRMVDYDDHLTIAIDSGSAAHMDGLLAQYSAQAVQTPSR